MLNHATASLCLEIRFSACQAWSSDSQAMIGKIAFWGICFANGSNPHFRVKYKLLFCPLRHVARVFVCYISVSVCHSPFHMRRKKNVAAIE